MKSIILSGGGDEKDTFLHHKLFVDKMTGNKKVLYIPGDAYPYDSSYEWIRSVLKEFGIRDIDMWSDATEMIDVAFYDGIYVGGGNTYNLLDKLRKSGIDLKVLEHLKKGKPYFGGSAGAVLMSHDINVCQNMDINEITLKNTSGLAQVLNYDIWCHYVDNDELLLLEYMRNNSARIIALSEQSGVFFNGTELFNIGNGDSIIYTKEEKTILCVGQGLVM